jgi:hypothetical protein
MVTLRAGNLLGWPSPLVLSGSQDPAGCACIPPGEPPSPNQPNRIGWEGVSEIEARHAIKRAKTPRRPSDLGLASESRCEISSI